MWKQVYLFLVLLRLYFALSPSYLHPDENFQGPEVIAGQVFSYPVHHTWEFTAAHPIRSVFPLWLVYGLPMLVLRWLWQGISKDPLPPSIAYWTLRFLMFTLSFVLEDWALQELVHSPRYRRIAVLLVASSYVTWTYQTHTFSNSIETLVVLWSLALIARITEDKERSSALASGILAFLVVVGTFNRITFPAYVLIPGLKLLPHILRKPFALVGIIPFGVITLVLAIFLDTAFYHREAITFRMLTQNPVITPFNNILYNTNRSNLATHGLHPFYNHALVNLPQLIGPVFPLLILQCWRRTTMLISAVSGVVLLSAFPHQEARFLLPAVPLILSSVKLPRTHLKLWVGAWIAFNVAFGVLMGSYHQGGVVPAQIHVSTIPDHSHVFWWKTYSPPIWLLNGKAANIVTTDLMGVKGEEMVKVISMAANCSSVASSRDIYLVAPASATYLDAYKGGDGSREFMLEESWRYNKHLNLDDLDIGEDGLWSTLTRVVGRRGLVLWNVHTKCKQ